MQPPQSFIFPHRDHKAGPLVYSVRITLFSLFGFQKLKELLCPISIADEHALKCQMLCTCSFLKDKGIGDSVPTPAFGCLYNGRSTAFVCSKLEKVVIPSPALACCCGIVTASNAQGLIVAALVGEPHQLLLQDREQQAKPSRSPGRLCQTQATSSLQLWVRDLPCRERAAVPQAAPARASPPRAWSWRRHSSHPRRAIALRGHPEAWGVSLSFICLRLCSQGRYLRLLPPPYRTAREDFR